MAVPHLPSDLTEAKRRLRAEAMVRRAGCDPASGRALAAHVLADCAPRAAAVISGFWPIESEIDVRPLLLALHDRGHKIALPVTPRRGEALHFRLWTPGDALQPERFGTLRPTGSPVTPDCLLVPLLAFDRRGHRLGYGAGYYDRTLAELPGAFALGCAYAVQEVPDVPAGPHDMRLDAVATERGVIFCKDD